MAILGLLAATSALAMTVTASPPAISTASPLFNYTTRSTTGIVSGGSGSFTYAWTFVSTDGSHGFSATDPTSVTTSFLITGIADLDTCSAVARLTVTDIVTSAAATVDVSISHQNTNFSIL